MPQQQAPPRIRERGSGDEDGERFTSRDLTKKQILLYIFEDFFKGFFIFGSLFLDVLVVTFLYMEPFAITAEPHVSRIFGFPIYPTYLILLSLFIDAILIHYQIEYYHKLFGEEAIRKRYEKKRDREKRLELEKEDQ